MFVRSRARRALTLLEVIGVVIIIGIIGGIAAVSINSVVSSSAEQTAATKAESFVRIAASQVAVEGGGSEGILFDGNDTPVAAVTVLNSLSGGDDALDNFESWNADGDSFLMVVTVSGDRYDIDFGASNVVQLGTTVPDDGVTPQ